MVDAGECGNGVGGGDVHVMLGGGGVVAMAQVLEKERLPCFHNLRNFFNGLFRRLCSNQTAARDRRFRNRSQRCIEVKKKLIFRSFFHS